MCLRILDINSRPSKQDPNNGIEVSQKSARHPLQYSYHQRGNATITQHVNHYEDLLAIAKKENYDGMDRRPALPLGDLVG